MPSVVFLLLAILTLVFFILALTTISNLFAFPRLRPLFMGTASGNRPLVSILIPARNEAAVIDATISWLLDQTYANFELIVLDDQSSDATAALVIAAAGGDARVRLVNGEPLPTGWLGKNWACYQLARAARGELLLFTDADVRWESEGVAALLAHREYTQADLLTVWPTQDTGSTAEGLVVPLMKFAIMSYLPLLAVHHLPYSAFAAANGQCLLFNRQAYDKIGGHARVRREIVEDISLARAIKKAGLRLRMVDGGGLIRCRMYTGWAGVRQGFGKNILAGHGDSVFFLLVSTLFHWTVFIFPWLVILFWPSWLLLALASGLLAVRWLGEWHVDRRPVQALGRALLMPLSVVLMTRIALQALQWRFGEGPEWKGRRLRG